MSESVESLALRIQECLPVATPLFVTCVFPSRHPTLCDDGGVVVVLLLCFLSFGGVWRGRIWGFGVKAVCAGWYIEWAIEW